MMVLPLGLAFWFMGAAAAWGQLGQTHDEIARQLGKPVRTNARVRQHRIIGGPVTVGDVHIQNGYFVRIVYLGDRSVQAEWTRREGPISRDQADAILAGASEGSRWNEMPGGDSSIRFFRRIDGQALASWTTGLDGSLLIAADGAGAIWQKLLLQEQ